jgi:hypothetical protein
MTLYDFFKNASIDDIAEFLASFGAKCVYISVGAEIDGDNVKNTTVYKDLYEQYRELLEKEI